MIQASYISVVVVSQFNGTSTPKGSYSAKTGDNDFKVNSSRYSLSTKLCESNSLSGQVWTKCPTRPDTQGRQVEAALMHPWIILSTILVITGISSFFSNTSCAYTSPKPGDSTYTRQTMLWKVVSGELSVQPDVSITKTVTYFVLQVWIVCLRYYLVEAFGVEPVLFLFLFFRWVLSHIPWH